MHEQGHVHTHTRKHTEACTYIQVSVYTCTHACMLKTPRNKLRPELFSNMAIIYLHIPSLYSGICGPKCPIPSQMAQSTYSLALLIEVATGLDVTG